MRIEKIIEPSEEVFRLQRDSLDEVGLLLPDAHVEAVGSMAVPLVGRPELDIMVLSENIAEDSKSLESHGYKQGPVVDGISNLKKVVDGVEVAIQVMSPNHSMVETHRSVITILRSNNELRKKYEDFKKTLSGLSREEYKVKKSRWIQEYIISLHH